MAGRGSYGEILREARERRGFDITSMARKLHIRPDILKAIEEADFERTPARGYTRNMVRAYANNLGLDASRITEMYLSEVHAYETGRPMSGFSYSNGYNSYIRHRDTGRFDDSSHSRQDYERRSSLYSEYDSYDNNSRNLQNSHTTRGRQPKDFRRELRGEVERQSSRQRTSRRQQSPGSSSRHRTNSRNAEHTSRSASTSTRKSKIGELYVGQSIDGRRRQNGYPSIYSANTGASREALMDKLPFLGIVAVVAVVVIIVLVLLFNGSKQSADNIPNIPISGLTDTSNPEGSFNSNITETAPTEAVFRYAVDDGSESWIEIYENGSDTPSFAGVVTGPDEQEIKVTGTLVMLTANPEPVHAAVDGSPIDFEQDSDSAYYRCEVDFKTILDEWKKEHPSIMINSSSSSSAA